MDSYIDQLCQHSVWADDEYWNAIKAHPPALADTNIRERLLHIHLAQHAFLWAIGPRGSEFQDRKLADFPKMEDLRAYGREHHRRLLALMATLPPAREGEVITGVPWLNATVGQALIQSAMHSHYHRAQNATRLRELGGVPPNTDFLQWLRAGRPIPLWAKGGQSLIEPE
jgi:uncharacterized damage-inducible protein DinB